MALHDDAPVTNQLRFVLLADDDRLQAWQVRCLEHLLGVSGVELVALILPSGSRRPRRRSAFGLYRRVLVRSRATRIQPAGPLLARVPRIECAVERVGSREHLAGPDLSRIRALAPDVALRFGFGVLGGEILTLPRFGVWSFHHGDDEGFRGSPAAFWEVAEGAAQTAVILQRLTERLDAGLILEKGFFRTATHSYARNLDQILFGSADFVAKIARLALAGNVAVLEGRPSASRSAVRRPPRAAYLLRFTMRMAIRRLRWSVGRLLTHDHWNIGVVAMSPRSATGSSRMSGVHWVDAQPRRWFLADPFGRTQADGTIGVVAEWYDYASGRGEIASLRLDRNGSILAGPKVAFDAGVHASYPYLVDFDGTTWCLPEVAEARRLRSWTSSSIAGPWDERPAELPGLRVIDPTVVEFAGRWWLFAGLGDDHPDVKLHLWHAPDPHGPWQPHVGNPVKTDIRSSRPAGTPFVVDGRLHRPAQDSSKTYGGRIAINRIDDLTTTSFAEAPIAWIEPEAGPWRDGVHTLAFLDDGLALVDGKRRRFIGQATARALRRLVPGARHQG